MATRSARRMLADNRAMEEEAERANPINPKHQIGARKGRTSLILSGSEYTGGGATPSMGLSQFRGGAMYGCGESESDEEELVGAGTKKGQMRKTARRAYEHTEAYGMGKHLGSHLHSLHGGGFFDDFAQGFMSVVKPVAGIARAVAPMLGPEGMAASGVMGALGLGRHKRSHKGAGKLVITHGGQHTTGAGLLGPGGTRQMVGGADTGKYEGKGNVSGPGYEALMGSGIISDLGIPVVSEIAGAFGLGKPKRHNPRAEVVRKVMSERGVSMIEASKIVKAEGLY